MAADRALQELTDPKNLSASFGDSESEWRLVSISSVLNALNEGGLDEPQARELALEALDELGGRIETQTMGGGLAASRRSGRSQRAVEAWYVPRLAVRN
jgi:hypothetical protein